MASQDFVNSFLTASILHIFILLFILLQITAVFTVEHDAYVSKSANVISVVNYRYKLDKFVNIGLQKIFIFSGYVVINFWTQCFRMMLL
jgi:hypothetical protein